ncbi:MAG: ATP-binding cassette domain-containing protein [Flavobacteriales bacterium]|nr:ATP-binding cassette domain-containing protein [Flavobacteriales bacterium]
MKPVQRLTRLLKVYQRQIGIILLFAAVGGIIDLSLPLGIQAVINLIMGGQVSISWIILILLIVLGILGSGYLHILQMMVGEHMQQSIFTRVAFEFTYRLPRIKPNASNKEWLPELVNRFFDTISLQKGVFKLLFETSKAALQIILGLLLLTFYNPIFAIYAFVIISLLWLTIKLTGKIGLDSGLEESKYKYKLVHWLEEVARTSDTFKLSGISDLPIKHTDKRLVSYLKSRNKHFKILVIQYGIMILLKALAAGTLLFAGGFMVMEGQLNLGQFVAAEIVIILMIGALEKLILSADTVYDVLISVEKLGTVTDFPLENTDENNPEKCRLAPPFEIEMRELALDFNDKKNSLLQDINLHVMPGEKVALVGYSGSGRTTLLKAIAGFYPLKEGSLLINGLPVPELELAKFRLYIGDGLQALDIFEGTVHENISLGRPGITEEETNEMLISTGIRDYMIANGMNMQTHLFPTGKGLPSGLQYRLIIARTFCGNPGLALLEDTVIPIPAKEREQLLDMIFNTKKQVTMIASTNRKDFAQRCDKIIWLDEGRIKAIGKPDNIIHSIPQELLF